MKKYNYIIGALTLATIASGCSHYSGTRKMKEKTSIGYAESTPRSEKNKSQDKSKGISSLSFTPEQAGVYIIGLIFAEADKAITKARTGDYKAVGRPLVGTGNFPESGYLVLVRSIADPENKYEEIASVKGLINPTSGSPAAELVGQICKKASITQQSLGDTIKDSLGSGLDDNAKISMLALCEVVRLDGKYNNLYAVTFSGLYYPLLAGSRFAGESSDPITRITKSKEAMHLEIYGPHGSGFTTGIVKVPLAWAPPRKKGERAPWLTGDDLLKAFAKTDNKEQIEQLKNLLDTKADGRLQRRQAFVVPTNIDKNTLRGDYAVTETSEATGWILKGLGQAKDAAEGAISGD